MRDGFENSEKEIIESVLSDRPDEFLNCSTMFEKLVKMQHYGIPTRIVDITSSPLVALFFACEQDLIKPENNQADGKIFVYSTNKNEILNYNSDKVRLLANMTRMKKFEYCESILMPFDMAYLNCLTTLKEYFFKLEKQQNRISDDDHKMIFTMIANIKFQEQVINFPSKAFKKNIPVTTMEFNSMLNLETLQDDYGKLNEDKKKLPVCTPNQEHIDWSIKMMDKFYKGIQNIDCKICLSSENKYCKRQLLNLVREEKPAFDDRILTEDLNHNYYVRGIKANERIKAQSGDFIITSKLSEGIEKLHINNTKKTEIIIKGGQNKINILKELDKLGINASTIYPEFTKYADYVKEKYKRY
jgi:hypothetical protein